jgi:aminoglycoside phosphotransferase (APT) family kinase protein
VLRDALDLLQSSLDALTAGPPRLLHGDLCSDHLLAAEGVLTGIVDLEFPRGGDPAWDLAYWDHHNRHRQSLEWILEGYDDASVRARIRPWSVAISLGYVVQHVPRGTLGPGFYDWVYDHLVAGLSSS